MRRNTMVVWMLCGMMASGAAAAIERDAPVGPMHATRAWTMPPTPAEASPGLIPTPVESEHVATEDSEAIARRRMPSELRRTAEGNIPWWRGAAGTAYRTRIAGTPCGNR